MHVATKNWDFYEWSWHWLISITNRWYKHASSKYWSKACWFIPRPWDGSRIVWFLNTGLFVLFNFRHILIGDELTDWFMVLSRAINVRLMTLIVLFLCWLQSRYVGYYELIKNNGGLIPPPREFNLISMRIYGNFIITSDLTLINASQWFDKCWIGHIQLFNRLLKSIYIYIYIYSLKFIIKVYHEWGTAMALIWAWKCLPITKPTLSSG